MRRVKRQSELSESAWGGVGGQYTCVTSSSKTATTMFISTNLHSVYVYICSYLNEFLYMCVCGNRYVHERHSAFNMCA